MKQLYTEIKKYMQLNPPSTLTPSAPPLSQEDWENIRTNVMMMILKQNRRVYHSMKPCKSPPFFTRQLGKCSNSCFISESTLVCLSYAPPEVNSPEYFCPRIICHYIKQILVLGLHHITTTPSGGNPLKATVEYVVVYAPQFLIMTLSPHARVLGISTLF